MTSDGVRTLRENCLVIAEMWAQSRYSDAEE